MVNKPFSKVIKQLRRVALVQDAELTDGKLLESFIAIRDESAFEALVRRHGPMVLGVCQRVTGNAADAEDAFQATFLVLARKATSVVPRDSVGRWLYGVAYRTGLAARVKTARRTAKEKQGFRLCPIPRPQAGRELAGGAGHPRSGAEPAARQILDAAHPVRPRRQAPQGGRRPASAAGRDAFKPIDHCTEDAREAAYRAGGDAVGRRPRVHAR